MQGTCSRRGYIAVASDNKSNVGCLINQPAGESSVKWHVLTEGPGSE